MTFLEHHIHPIPPLYDSGSKILILGSFPSVKSREVCFFYGHPQNRFWRVVSAVVGAECPKTIEEKQAFLHSAHIAVWDVIKSCDIEGSSDSSIKNAVPNDLSEIFDAADIRAVFANGTASYNMYRKYNKDGREITKLPSTSPANAAYSVDRLIEEWKQIREFLK